MTAEAIKQAETMIDQIANELEVLRATQEEVTQRASDTATALGQLKTFIATADQPPDPESSKGGFPWFFAHCPPGFAGNAAYVQFDSPRHSSVFVMDDGSVGKGCFEYSLAKALDFVDLAIWKEITAAEAAALLEAVDA